MKITLVKKINPDGRFCSKCIEVQEKLEQSGYIQHIDEVLIADARDPSSRGMKLASTFKVDRAPFFVVEREGEAPEIYTIYFRFVKEVLNKKTGLDAELKAILNEDPDLDFQ